MSRQLFPPLVGRTYLVSQGEGSSIGELEDAAGQLVSIEGVSRNGEVITVASDLRLQRGDRVLAVGRREAVMGTGHELGPETSGVPGLDSPLAVRQVVVTNKLVSGQTVSALLNGGDGMGGVYLTDIQRVDHHLPAVGETELHQGDTLTVVGARAKVERFASRIGATVRQDTADYIYISPGICLGVLLGMATIHAADVNLALGTGGGCLIAGLVFGWFRAQRPTFGAYPLVAAQTAKDIGLSIFIAVTGLAAGPDAGPLLKQ